MNTIARRQLCRTVALGVGGLLLVGRPASGKTMRFSVYTTGVQTATALVGYSSMIDGSSGCSHGGYVTATTVVSPSHRVGYSQAGGLASNASLSISGEYGTYQVVTNVTLNCSCVGSLATGNVAYTQLQVPTSLAVTFSQYVPPGSGQIYNLERHYQVRDQTGQAMLIFGMSVTEQYSNVSGTCAIQVQTGSGSTNSNGQFRDNYTLSGNPPNPCTTTATQRHFVNTLQVSTFAVTWTRTAVSVQ